MGCFVSSVPVSRPFILAGLPVGLPVARGAARGFGCAVFNVRVCVLAVVVFSSRLAVAVAGCSVSVGFRGCPPVFRRGGGGVGVSHTPQPTVKSIAHVSQFAHPLNLHFHKLKLRGLLNIRTAQTGGAAHSFQ